jgi:hypothetical protein
MFHILRGNGLVGRIKAGGTDLNNIRINYGNKEMQEV